MDLRFYAVFPVSSGLSFPIEKQVFRERGDPQNKEYKNQYSNQAAKWHHEPFVSHHHVIRIHFSFALPHRGGPPVMLVRRFPRSGVHAATSSQ